MGSEVTVALNPGSGGAAVAAYSDASSRVHQEVVVQTQNGTSDPVSVSAANPLPVVQTGPLLAGSAAIGTVALNAALPAGANNIGSVNQGTPPWQMGGDVANATADSGNPVKVGGIYNTTPPVYTNAQRANLQTDVNGNLKVNIAAGQNAGGTSSNFSSAFPAAGTAVGASDGTNMKPFLVDGSGNLKVNIAAGGVAASTDNSAFSAGAGLGLPMMGVFNDSIANASSGDVAVPRITATRQLYVVPQANVIGGWSPGHLVSAASTNATSVKASAGSLGSIYASNSGAGFAYVKFYNKASAPTVGTDTPVYVLGLPAGGGGSHEIPAGLAFSTGIAFAITGGAADSDATATAASQVVLSYSFA